MARTSLDDEKIKKVLKLNLTVVATKARLRELYGKACSSDKLKELKLVLEQEQKSIKKHEKAQKSTPKAKPEAITVDLKDEKAQKAQKSTQKAQTKYAKLKEKYDFLLDSNAKLLLENQTLQKNQMQFSPVEENSIKNIFQSYIKQMRSKSFTLVESASILYKQITGKDHPTPLTPPPKKPKKVRA